MMGENVRILVFSDSHGDSESMEKIIKKFYPDVALFLGDGIEDFLMLENEFPHTKFFSVIGNVDPSNFGVSERLQTFDDVAIYMTHLEYPFKIKEDREKIFEIIKLNAQIILYGNTHVPELFVSHGITFMNPGTISKSFGFRTFGLIDIIDNEYFCEIRFADLFVL